MRFGADWQRDCHWNWHRIRHERYYRPEDHDDQADPDPGNQRVQVRFDDRAAGGFVFAFIDQINIGHEKKILAEAGINPRQGLRLAAGFIEAAFGIHGRDQLAAAEDIDDGPLVGVVRIVVLRVGLADERIGADVDLVAEGHLFFYFFD